MKDNHIEENTPTIETDRLILRKFTPQDVPNFYLIMNDKETNVFLPWYPPENLTQAEKMLEENYLCHYPKPSAYRYAVCRRIDDCPIGYVTLNDGDSNDFGYGLRREFWRQGIVTEAAAAIVQRIKAAGIPYITATYDRNNPRSGQVMKKLGMRYKYSYEEKWLPKDITVIFRMYQLNFDGSDFTYLKYWQQHPNHFEENDV